MVMTSFYGPRSLRIMSICWYLIPPKLKRQERRRALWDGTKTRPVSLTDGMTQGWFNGTETHRDFTTWHIQMLWNCFQDCPRLDTLQSQDFRIIITMAHREKKKF